MLLKVRQDNQKQRIINLLLLHSSFMNDLGLLNGKMGISIAFFHLFRETGNAVYENYAGELIDEIYEEINVSSSWNFADGLAGIGYGIEYLVRNKFIDADTDDALADIDSKLTTYAYYFPTSLGLENGLLGVAYYFFSRVKYKLQNTSNIRLLTNKQLLIHVLDEIDRRISHNSNIFAEPTKELNELEKTHNAEPNINGDTIKTFNLFWNYPILIDFLSEVFTHNIYNTRICEMLERLLAPLNNSYNWPKLNSNRLLMALALTKMLKEHKVPVFDELPSNWPVDAFYLGFKGNLELVITELLAGVTPEAINGEIGQVPFMKNGALGIAWVYSQLYKITGNIDYERETEYWLSDSKNKLASDLCTIDTLTKVYARLGLLNGISGYIKNCSKISLLSGKIN